MSVIHSPPHLLHLFLLRVTKLMALQGVKYAHQLECRHLPPNLPLQVAAHGADTEELRQQASQAGHDVAVQYRELLQLVMHVLNKPTMDSKANLPTVSRKIAQCVTVLAQTAELLKGADWVDPDDPMLIAENELLGAAQSIEKAAKKLASLKPRREAGASNVSIALLIVSVEFVRVSCLRAVDPVASLATTGRYV